MWNIRETSAKTILTPVSGFLRIAGFTHSLTPARNCTYGCTYCYVPTMRVYGGLTFEDWTHWGQFTTLKTNAAECAAREMRPDRVVYCSPLVDPYQPAERLRPQMPDLLEAVISNPPRIFVIQTRGPLILRDLGLLQSLARVAILRISFSVTTDRDDVRKRYEPHCEPNGERLSAIRELRKAGLEVYATLAPLLPCDPERLAQLAIDASGRDLIGDPLHIRETKGQGATTRAAALELARRFGEADWFRAEFQRAVVLRIEQVAAQSGHTFKTGPLGFGQLAQGACR